jgi:hypothetical protein
MNLTKLQVSAAVAIHIMTSQGYCMLAVKPSSNITAKQQGLPA